MLATARKIMNRVRGHGRGNWVFSSRDFMDLGSRAAVDQALSRLAKAGKLRRVKRGLYDLPRRNPLLKADSPAKMDSVVKAIARRKGLTIVPDNIVAANSIGLTNAVPAKPVYVTDGPSRTISIDGRTIRLKTASIYLRPWIGSPARPVVQALLWLGKDLARTPSAITTLRAHLPKKTKRALARNKAYLPSWAIDVVDAVAA